MPRGPQWADARCGLGVFTYCLPECENPSVCLVSLLLIARKSKRVWSHGLSSDNLDGGCHHLPFPRWSLGSTAPFGVLFSERRFLCVLVASPCHGAVVLGVYSGYAATLFCLSRSFQIHTSREDSTPPSTVTCLRAFWSPLQPARHLPSSFMNISVHIPK